MEIDVFKGLFAAAVGIIGWFLKGLINDVKTESQPIVQILKY